MNEDFRARLDQLREQYARCEGRIDGLDSIVSQLVGMAVEQNEISHAHNERMATRHEEDMETHRQRMAAFDERMERMAIRHEEDMETHRQRMAVLDERLDRIAQIIENSLRRQGNGHQPQ